MKYKVINRFSGDWWAFDKLDGRVTESSAKHLLGCRMTVNEADDFEYMQSVGLSGLNNGQTLLLIED